MTEAILVVNAGSSSLKFSIYAIENEGGLRLTSRAQMDGIPGHPQLRARDARGVVKIGRASCRERV